MNGPAAEVQSHVKAAAETQKQRKQVLRAEMRRRRAFVEPREATMAGERAAGLLVTLLDGQPSRQPLVAALFASLPGEIDTAPIERVLHARGGQVAWPRIDGDHLTLHRCDRAALQPTGRFQILEPAADVATVPPVEVSLFIVPGLAFDPAGRRLGYGRGYYDRLLAAAPGALRVAPCLPEQIVSLLPIEAHDQPVDALLLCGHSPHTLPTEARPEAARLATTRTSFARLKEIH